MKRIDGSRLTPDDARAMLPHWQAFFMRAAERNLGGSLLLREMQAAWTKSAYPLLRTRVRKARKAGGR